MDSIRCFRIHACLLAAARRAYPGCLPLSIRAVSRAAGQILEEVRVSSRSGHHGSTKTPDSQVVVFPRPRQKELVPWRRSGIDATVVGLVLQVEPWRLPRGDHPLRAIACVFLSNARCVGQCQEVHEDEPRNLKENTGKGSERHKAGCGRRYVGDR